MKLLIASKNSNKIAEIENKFSDIDELELISILSMDNRISVIEDGDTFSENALKKARAVSKYYGLSALSDDSGLVIESLDGRPGIHSSRYGGRGLSDNVKNLKILDEMKNITDNRRASFVCVIAIVLSDNTEFLAEGTCHGIIADSLTGKMGFGYDPIFFLPEYHKTMAELTMDEKNRISHRARALDMARDILLGIINK